MPGVLGRIMLDQKSQGLGRDRETLYFRSQKEHNVSTKPQINIHLPNLESDTKNGEIKR